MTDNCRSDRSSRWDPSGPELEIETNADEFQPADVDHNFAELRSIEERVNKLLRVVSIPGFLRFSRPKFFFFPILSFDNKGLITILPRIQSPIHYCEESIIGDLVN